MLNDWIFKKYLSNEFVYLSQKKFKNAEPFPHLFVDGFFDEAKLNIVFKELLKENFERKESDLFSLYQTQDFETSQSKKLLEFREILISKEFLSFMESLTGLKLKTWKISLAGSLYEDGDYLLCHDDRLEGRKIAFMIYLNDLEKKNGGSLDLFSSVKGKPDNIIKFIQPKFNRFVIFEVSRTSFHQVAEVIGKQRFAIGGWFYGK
jgi:Rps23 Pro-64 3,4-dihydroxylase Tpa1-like proline 4-hydroxylase